MEWITALGQLLSTVPGIETAYYPSETDDTAALPAALGVFPCAVVLPVRGSMEYSQGGPAVGIHQGQITVYAASQVIPESYAVALPFIKRVRNALAANVTLGGVVDYVLPAAPIFYEGPGGVTYGQDEQGRPRSHLGIVFNVTVKAVETDVTVSA